MNKIILNLGLTHCPAISWIMEWIPWRQSSVDFLPGPTKTIDDTTKEWKVPLRARTIVISHLISPTEDVMNRPRTRRRSLHSVVVRLEGSIVQRCVEMWNVGQKLFQCPGRYMGVSQSWNRSHQAHHIVHSPRPRLVTIPREIRLQERTKQKISISQRHTRTHTMKGI